MLANGVIRPSKSPWAAPVMLADKKNGKIRFCVDYRRLNEKTVKWEYPIPRMDDILSTIAGASLYSVMDLTSAFWSIPIREQDKKYTAFTCKQGLFEWSSMPFGLKNAPATQQRMMDAILAGLNWQCCVAYIDDIVIFSKTFEEHMQTLDLVFAKLAEAGLFVN